MPDWSSIIPELRSVGFNAVKDSIPAPVSGGDISAAWRLSTTSGDLFVKTGPPSSAHMFSAEAEGLNEIAAVGVLRTPRVIASGETGSTAYLALEWLSFERSNNAVERKFGEQLAALHHATKNQYGWHRDNTIGLTLQKNAWRDDWLDFFREQRLAYQLQMAVENGFGEALQIIGSRLLKRLPIYFNDEAPAASLLHGDLWSGNWACSDGAAIVFDPAVYYGDRESDLAMTWLFGGFGDDFYAAYEYSWPLPDGHRERQHLYQLYHVLNHLNLFGSAYLAQAIRLIEKLL